MTSGKCGDNLTWTLDDDGTLTISGRGNMYNYSSANPAPWGGYCSSITKVVIENGTTTIGTRSFNWCTGLTSVIISDSVKAIGVGSFRFCTSLTSVIIPDSVTTIGDATFCACKSLTSVIIPDSVTIIGYFAFKWCESLKEIHYPSGRGFEKILSQGNNAKLISYTLKPPAQVKPPTQVKPPAQVEPSFKLTPMQTQPSLFDSPPPAETNCTVYKNTKISRAENIAPPNAKKLKLVDENIAEIRRAAELAAMNIVMTIERDLGFVPEDVSSQNLGYDIKSTSRDGKTLRLIEVKGRHIDAETVTVSRNEIDAALNNPDDFILAIVRLDGGNNETTYIRKPFELPPDRAALSVNFSIQKLVDVSEIVPG